LVAVLLFVLCLVTVFQVTPVDAQSQVYIRNDGTVEGTDKITCNGNVYTVTADINGGIIVEKDNITIEGSGHVLQGTGAEHTAGLTLRGRIGVTVSDFRIESFEYGILVVPEYAELGIPSVDATGNKITKNVVTNCTEGIALAETSLNEVTSNTVSNNDDGIVIARSSYNIREYGYNQITGNTITNNKNAIVIKWTTNNEIVGNIIQNNTNAIDGNMGSSSSSNTVHHNAFVNNTINLANPELRIQWDNGKEGNYWSNYNGTDTNGDGVGETPYTIYKVIQDIHPLVNMIPEFPTTAILPLFALATVLAAAFYQKMKTN
jgi:parallel beta-helix repeat protein